MSEVFVCVSCDRGFLRSDKPIGTAHIKLEKLETESEVREIVEVRRTWREMRAVRFASANRSQNNRMQHPTEERRDNQFASYRIGVRSGKTAVGCKGSLLVTAQEAAH